MCHHENVYCMRKLRLRMTTSIINEDVMTMTMMTCWQRTCDVKS